MRAAERAGITKSALSNALARLRIMLQDQLFIRERFGLQPMAIIKKSSVRALKLAPDGG